ncbi:hypothetical protein I6A84_06915 [Frankia sp. CNm7]|uniref:Uncharacterized protein n=1 Tax=Frankia nepalensis TaxID=1836974 RepID=A0A937RDP9_9ACTN|nr:hypothetical protein [Frankia nepalensis]MBL7501617.1 hypothetical protein [Frankia nepalensis]MBL7514314.1 hypothetical protein [Frankia nepalensis]MBL7517861.1 hypothetical protein [Frankia nepalensis]MBL7628047.1 hypothetical protein [Frankia nepalensis]
MGPANYSAFPLADVLRVDGGYAPGGQVDGVVDQFGEFLAVQGLPGAIGGGDLFPRAA